MNKEENIISAYGGSDEMEEINVNIQKPNIKKYIGCYTKKGPVPKVRVKYDPYKTKKIYNSKNKDDFKVVSNNGKGYKYEILIEYGKEYEFDLSNVVTAFMVENLIRSGKIKLIEGD